MLLDIKIELTEPQSEVLIIRPVSVHTRSACNLVVWESKAKGDEEDWRDIKATIAKLMDRLLDIMRDYQEYAPFIALVDVKEESKEWKKLMGDQDWHRGRFILQEIRSYAGQSIKEVKDRWLGPLQKAQYKPRKISNEDFIKELMRASKDSKAPNGAEASLYERYVINLKDSIEEGRPNNFMEIWLDELVRDINSLVGESILEGGRHGG
jgi:hypothetical protein